MTRLFLAYCLSGLALAGCTGPANARDAVDENAAARKLYVVKCAKCHKFYDPAKYSDEEWKIWMAKMSKKSKLKPQQEEMLARYIDANLRGKKAPEK